MCIHMSFKFYKINKSRGAKLIETHKYSILIKMFCFYFQESSFIFITNNMFNLIFFKLLVFVFTIFFCLLNQDIANSIFFKSSKKY